MRTYQIGCATFQASQLKLEFSENDLAFTLDTQFVKAKHDFKVTTDKVLI